MSEGGESPFEGLLGTTSELRVAEKLLAMPSFEFSVSELAKTTDLSRLSIYGAIRKFTTWGFVSELDRGKRVRYQLNSDSPIALALYDFNHALVAHILGDAGGQVVAAQDAEPPMVHLDYVKEVLRDQVEEAPRVVFAVAPTRAPARVAVA